MRPQSKAVSSRIPPPQCERIKQRFIAGQSVRQISREEGRARETVHRIVKSADVQNYVRMLRQQLYSLGTDAITTVAKAIRGGDSRLAYELLQHIGAIPTSEERHSAAMQPSEDYDQDTEVKKMMGRLVEVAIHRATTFGTRCPELEADLEKIGGRINYQTGEIEPVDVSLKPTLRSNLK